MQRPLEHLLGLVELALIGIEFPQVLNYIEGRQVQTERLLIAKQRPLVHLLGFVKLALILIKSPKVINRGER